MPLPNAEAHSGRVYKLLHTESLGSLNAIDGSATMARVGSPISIEQLNEDELRRLVLVFLARVTTQGEWEGLF
ncbi:MAG TPA: hypothetical protein EYN66_05330 [Myxococcales bacterium]|nr:hypothetical protein [Myxococcales bacterium]